MKERISSGIHNYCEFCLLEGKHTPLNSRQRRLCGTHAEHSLVNTERKVIRNLQLVANTRRFRERHPDRARAQDRKAYWRQKLNRMELLPLVLATRYKHGGPSDFWVLPALSFKSPVPVDLALLRGVAELFDLPTDWQAFMTLLIQRYPAWPLPEQERELTGYVVPETPLGPEAFDDCDGVAAVLGVAPHFEQMVKSILDLVNGEADNYIDPVDDLTASELTRAALQHGSESRRFILRHPRGILIAAIAAPPITLDELPPPLHSLIPKKSRRGNSVN